MVTHPQLNVPPDSVNRKLYHAREREGDILLHLQSCTSNALRHSLSAQGRPVTSPHAQRAQCAQRTHQAVSNTAHLHRPQRTHDAAATPTRASGVGRTQPHPTATKYDLQLCPTTTKNKALGDYRFSKFPGKVGEPEVRVFSSSSLELGLSRFLGRKPGEPEVAYSPVQKCHLRFSRFWAETWRT